MRGIRLGTIAIPPLSVLAPPPPAASDVLPDRLVASLRRLSTLSAATLSAERIITLKMARGIAMAIPQSALIRADEVIQ